MAPGRPAENEPTRSHSGHEPRTDGPALEPRDRPAAEEFGGSRFAAGELLAGRYRIVGLLGRGGMGEVYRADDLRLGVSVALKFLPPQRTADPRWRERMHDEARIAREIAHRHVCRVYDIVDHGDEACIAMEYVDGENLASLLRRIGRFPEDRGLEIARQICAGLAAAHERGILHQDLKPANVMLDGRGHARITDFGIAALSLERAGGAGAGTPAYMAPEQLAGKPVTARSDLFALGLVLHEIFTGRPAHDAGSIEQLRQLYESGTGASTSHLDRVDPAIARVISRCLEIDPARRPASAIAVAAALPGGDPLAAALEAGETPSPELVAAAGDTGRLHPGLALIGAALVVAGVTALIALGTKFSLHRHLSFEKHPEALRDRAAEVLHVCGWHDPPVDTAHGFVPVWNYLLWISRLDDPPDPQKHLQAVRPEALAYWYRQSPEKLVPFSTWVGRGLVGAENPPWAHRGEAYVSLDLAGRLRRFYVLPSQGIEPLPADDGAAPPDTGNAAELDWSKVFDLAGLDISRFEPTQPRYRWDRRCDQVFAWRGVYPEEPAIAISVEAGATGGKPVYFRFISPWEEPGWEARLPPRRAAPFVDGFRRIVVAVFEKTGPLVMVLLVSVPLVAAVMGFRSQHRARADRKGAWRIAIALFLFVVAWGCLAGDRPWPRDQNDVWHILAVAFFIGGTAGGLYFGLEPHIRRLWPSAMVGWTRLLGGRLLDPLVGRNILAGIIGGVTISIFQQLAGGAGLLAGEPTMRIFWGSLDFAWRDHLALASLLVSFTIPILMGFTYLLLLVFLRHVTNRMWLAAAIFVAIYPFLELWNGAAQPWRLLVALPTAGVILLLCMRAGMLAVQACLVCNMALVSVPMVSDLGAWYARGTIVILVFVGLLTAGAAAAAAYGRASFARASSPGGD